MGGIGAPSSEQSAVRELLEKAVRAECRKRRSASEEETSEDIDARGYGFDYGWAFATRLGR